MNYDFLNKEEGCILHSYQDQAGIWTIGYGSTLYQSGKEVGKGETITQQQAEDLRNWEVENKSIEIKKLLGNSVLNDNQMTAIISLVYNIGIEGFKISSLLKTIKNNPNDSTIIPLNQVTDISVKNWMQKNNIQSINKIEMNFLVWNKITIDGKHVFDEGLFQRRIREWKLYQS